MKRFTQYLYEYQQEKRIRNIGFVKAEQKETSCVLQIYGRGMGVSPSKEMKIYLFYRGDEGLEGIFQGCMSMKKPVMSCTLTFADEDIGDARSVDEILGVMLAEPDGRRYAAVWNGQTVNVQEIVIERRKKALSGEEHTEPPKKALSGEEHAEPSKKVLPGEERTEPLQSEIVKESEVISEAPKPEAAEDTGADAEEAAVRICEKIQRRDLARLPRRDWRLANNNFLLHGFYNYHHLLWIEEDGELYIGVPGVNHAREVQAAKAFGFMQFRHASDTDVELSEEETNPREDFGYFCRRIERSE